MHDPAALRRLKIYALHSNRPKLGSTAGDLINEGRFLTSLSQFADVYYNGQLFRPDQPDFGLTAEEIVVPTSGYDLYYVRSNPDVFAQLPHPKIAMAYPYNETVFQTADALVVTTEAWRRGLTPYSERNMFSEPMREWYGVEIVAPKHIINIKQTLDTHFLPEPVEHDVIEARARMTFGKAIGFFGRIDSNTFPYILLSAYKDVIRSHPEIRFVVGGTVRIPLDREIVRVPRMPHEQMPAMLTACMATATDEGNDSRFLGSGKVLDSMARSVPVIAYKSPTRVEQLGDYYPLYYEDEATCRQRILEVMFDEDVRAEARRQMAIRIEHFLPQARAQAIQKDFEELVRIRSNSEMAAETPAHSSMKAA
ncbi:glycosyltransferase [Pseudaminobacter sp. 19-2017]|uniref:Glycosyltransferase n=1 Tax=Pseudaminobacter soli (ex Zhang et al. 2022) TaxID=2831468 RepID=A0A942DWE3_9HYPH|nr:glycosyltransferase [Pseudaminobacter soli]MBS3648524.1 glycosyltransferase [Pseudaminobacter soli]